MNIFVLDTNPNMAARYHNDRHVIKMILESAQMLSTAHVFLDGPVTSKARVPWILRPTHINHPCAKWVREASENYVWLYQLMEALLMQYRARFGKIHKYERNGLFHELSSKLPLNIPIGPRTPFAQAMPPQYRNCDPVAAYRAYYFNEKQHLAQWRYPADKPVWWDGMEFRAKVRAHKIASA